MLIDYTEYTSQYGRTSSYTFLLDYETNLEGNNAKI